MIQALLTGKAAHATPVIAAWPQVDDPTKSAVVGKVNVAVLPHCQGGKSTPTLGHFIGGDPEEHSEGSAGGGARVPALVPDL